VTFTFTLPYKNWSYWNVSLAGVWGLLFPVVLVEERTKVTGVSSSALSLTLNKETVLIAPCGCVGCGG
jgi:hypothetical protein